MLGTSRRKSCSLYRTFIASLINVIIILPILFSDLARSAGNPPGLSFLRLEIDARGIALGGALTASGTGLGALHWNPAGLARSTSNEAVFSHSRGFDGIDTEFIGLLLKKGADKAAAISILSNNIGGIELRTRPTHTPDGIISAHDFYAGISYSHLMYKHLYAGITVKYLYQKIYFNSASGYSGDIGACYILEDRGLLFGIALRNVGSMGAFSHKKPTMPALIHAGAAYNLPFLPDDKHSVQISGGYELLFKGKNRLHSGAEYRYAEKYSLRAGYVTGFESKGLSLGIGITVRQFGLDYAFLPDVTSFGSQHVFSIRLKI